MPVTGFSSLLGSSGFITRLSNKYSFVILANTSINDNASLFSETFYPTLEEIILAKTA